ncbi:acyl-CoA synthase [Photobacterium swingsii]|uniref:Acyl-CoA synthase n=1 Tax=Photobacterium swingsii TaxID=680026 RepID=A0A0J8XVR2_9GAMM|nr:AMP-binding protein [Photobacterium swingsii]KMV29459.1 acyl-CoA synthase [Photobacterium swingsii]PSW20895.1 acyl-CoA synthase [Photobacterium swingsii]
MIYVNDDYYGQHYFDDLYATFSDHPVLGQCQGKRIAVCCSDPAYWLALCLYVKAQGGSLYPIYAQTPRLAAKRLADRAQCHYLLIESGEHCMVLTRQTIDPSDNDVQPVLVQTSSGTTGEPKVITRSWEMIEKELTSYVVTFTQPNTMTPLIACPITHSYGLIAGVLVALKRGLKPVIISNINPKYLIKKLLTTEKPLLYSSPTLIQSVVKLYPSTARIHAVMTSGTVIPQEWFMALKTKTDHVFQQYGCSEVGCIAVNADTQGADQLGYPLPHLIVEAGESRDTPAEIKITADGRSIHTHDLGYYNAQGVLCFVSRLDDTINVAGLHVYPKDVEDVVMELPEVSEAVIFKRHDSLAGDRVCLQFIASERLEPSRIRHWCSTRLASFQLPVDIEQVEHIEKLANGKISRKALAERGIAIPALG